MKIKIPKIKMFQIIAYSKYFYGILGLAIVGVGILLFMFINKNFYQTITQSQEIVLLKKEVAPDSINLKVVNSVIDALDQKSATTSATITAELNQLKDPFSTRFMTIPAQLQPSPIQID